MKNLLYIFLFVFVLSSCKKESTSNVLYKVIPEGNAPAYIVRYTLADGTTQSQSIAGSTAWSSESVKGFAKGSSLSFSLESTGGTYHMYIYINGIFDKHRDAGGGGTQTLESSIPN